MFWAILGGGAVVAAIVLWFLWTLLGWVGLTFGIIALVGLAAVGWYAYVLYGKASDLWNQLGVVGKRVAAIGTLLGEIKLPDEAPEASLPARRGAAPVPAHSSGRGPVRQSTAARANSPRTPVADSDEEDEFFLP